jgi:hypothetical protein
MAFKPQHTTALIDARDQHEFKMLQSAAPDHSQALAYSSAETQPYALKKRLFVPRWWLEGYLLKHCAKDAFVIDQLFEKGVRVMLGGPDFPNQHLSLLVYIWNCLVMHLLQDPQSAVKGFLRIPLDKYLRGTSKEISELLRLVENYWASPFQASVLQTVLNKTSKRPRREILSVGVVNFVRHVSIEVHSQTSLLLDLSVPLEAVCSGNILSASSLGLIATKAGHAEKDMQRHQELPGLVSLNPDVLQVFGQSRTISKKLMNYLLVEHSKSIGRVHAELDGWHGRDISSKDIAGIHKEQLAQTASLYDHGIYGWAASAPPTRVSTLKKMFQCGGLENTSRKMRAGALIHCWKLSQQSLLAREMEETLANRISVTPSGYVKKNLETFSLPTKLVLESNPQPSPVAPAVRQVQPSPSPHERLMPIVNNVGQNSDEIEFLERITEYYESLTPTQRKAFERERASMSDQQFRKYVLPILRKDPRIR